MDHSLIRSRLRKRRSELLGEIDERSEAVAAVTVEDAEDKVFERLDDEVLSALSAADRDEVARIDLALGKIADGSYGICEECGQKIAPARLEAMPHALLCITCANEAERRI